MTKEDLLTRLKTDASEFVPHVEAVLFEEHKQFESVLLEQRKQLEAERDEALQQRDHFAAELARLQQARGKYNRTKARRIARRMIAEGKVS